MEQDRSRSVSVGESTLASPDNLNPSHTLETDRRTPEPVISESYQKGMAGRRRKAATVLVLAWGGTIALHLVTWGSWVVLGLTGLVGFQVLRILLARSLALPEPLQESHLQDWPTVSLLVAAKNEEAVIGQLAESLCNLDYPCDRYEVWIIDDNSSDGTPQVLEQLQTQYPQLQVFRRSPGATGGKSGALNQVLTQIKGDVIGVFDADAKVPEDLLQKVLPLFQRERVGAVQVRKAIMNANQNFLTLGQSSELMLDAFFQQQRVALGGLGELRGNGQFIRRKALEQCAGFNEETITDDLDLTFRLHLEQWDVFFCFHPAVGEEAVTRPLALWHQRNRWAEGGYQRCLDYWRFLIRNRMGSRKTLDLFCFFWITQYFIPTATVPDLLMALIRHRPPIYSPIAALTIGFSMITMFLGIRQAKRLSSGSKPSNPFTFFATVFQTFQGVVYMLHWFVVMASVTARMSFRPKRLRWVKTAHHGN